MLLRHYKLNTPNRTPSFFLLAHNLLHSDVDHKKQSKTSYASGKNSTKWEVEHHLSSMTQCFLLLPIKYGSAPAEMLVSVPEAMPLPNPFQSLFPLLSPPRDSRFSYRKLLEVVKVASDFSYGIQQAQPIKVRQVGYFFVFYQNIANTAQSTNGMATSDPSFPSIKLIWNISQPACGIINHLYRFPYCRSLLA